MKNAHSFHKYPRRTDNLYTPRVPLHGDKKGILCLHLEIKSGSRKILRRSFPSCLESSSIKRFFQPLRRPLNRRLMKHLTNHLGKFTYCSATTLLNLKTIFLLLFEAILLSSKMTFSQNFIPCRKIIQFCRITLLNIRINWRITTIVSPRWNTVTLIHPPLRWQRKVNTMYPKQGLQKTVEWFRIKYCGFLFCFFLLV